MSVTVDTDVIVDGFEGLQYDVGRELIDIWFSKSQEVLFDADSSDDSSNLFPIAQSGQPPHWDADLGAWVFTYTHLAAVFHEFGAEPHIIRARRATFLVFEWPDAPQEIREQFSETFPTVFFREVHHPGVPAIGYVRAGREAALQGAQEGML